MFDNPMSCILHIFGHSLIKLTTQLIATIIHAFYSRQLSWNATSNNTSDILQQRTMLMNNDTRFMIRLLDAAKHFGCIL